MGRFLPHKFDRYTFEWDGNVLWVRCPECGYQQADMGNNIECEKCGTQMPTGQRFLDDDGQLKPEYL